MTWWKSWAPPKSQHTTLDSTTTNSAMTASGAFVGKPPLLSFVLWTESVYSLQVCITDSDSESRAAMYECRIEHALVSQLPRKLVNWESGISVSKMEEGHYLRNVRLLQTEEGDSEPKEPERMMNIITAMEAKESKTFSEKWNGLWCQMLQRGQRKWELGWCFWILQIKSYWNLLWELFQQYWDQKLDVVRLEVNATRGSIINNQYIFSLTID